MKARVDTSAFKKMTQSFGQEVRVLAETSSEKSAKAMAAQMKRIAPRESGLLQSTIEAVKTDKGWAVYSGGIATQKKIGKRTYDRVVLVGGGKSRKVGKTRAGKDGNVVVDYARIVEFGSKDGKHKADPYHRPSRQKARKSHRARVRREINKLAKKHSR